MDITLPDLSTLEHRLLTSQKLDTNHPGREHIKFQLHYPVHSTVLKRLLNITVDRVTCLQTLQFFLLTSLGVDRNPLAVRK